MLRKKKPTKCYVAHFLATVSFQIRTLSMESRILNLDVFFSHRHLKLLNFAPYYLELYKRLYFIFYSAAQTY